MGPLIILVEPTCVLQLVEANAHKRISVEVHDSSASVWVDLIWQLLFMRNICPLTASQAGTRGLETLRGEPEVSARVLHYNSSLGQVVTTNSDWCSCHSGHREESTSQQKRGQRIAAIRIKTEVAAVFPVANKVQCAFLSYQSG